MPFNKDGIWVPPTEVNIANFNNTLILDKRKPVNVPMDTMKALVSGLETKDETAPSSLDFFKAIGRIKGGVDIVIPVYGGLHILKKCVESVIERSCWNYNIILVDDCSPDPTVREWIKSISTSKMNIRALYNKKNRGFAATVNRGIQAGNNPYIVVLNSDVITTEGWLPKMIMAMEADPKNQIVNPVTNNTALVNVNMYPGKNYLDMDSAFNRVRNVRYPEAMPTGFCFMIRRSLYKEIGPLDEAYGSYGEETDFWFRAIKTNDSDGRIKGYKAVIADNCYMFHERGTSFSQLGDDAHMKQRRAGSERFHKLHPDFGEWQKGFDVADAMGGLRTKIPPAAFHRKYKGNVAWLVKSAGPCGGMNFITDIVNELIELGYNAKVCVISDNPDPNFTHQVTSHLHTAPVLFTNPDTFIKEFREKVFNKGIIFSAVTELSNVAKTLQIALPSIEAYNHVQSWDVGLAKAVKRDEIIPSVKNAYISLPNLVSSNWVANKLKSIGAVVSSIHLPGVDPDLFHVRDRNLGDDRFTVGVLLDSMYSYKGYAAGVEFCQKLKDACQLNGREVRILGIGANSVPECPFVIGMSSLSQSAMALLMANEIDVFVDPAVVHSYGLPALEALFSGCAAVTFRNNGEKEYASYWEDKLYTNNNIDHCVNWVVKYKVPEKRTGFDPEKHNDLVRSTKVKAIISDLFPKEVPSFKTCIEVITPHMRKHGGPTTIITMANQLKELGHDVCMSMIYTDWNPEVINMAKCPVRTEWRKVPDNVKVVIINSDNPFAAEIMVKNPDKKYIMYKLSHNERFKKIEDDNLKLEWDHIVTSTEWLRQACLAPRERWEHTAWPEDKVSVVGWYHYAHSAFNMPPQNRTYGNAAVGFRIGTLIHDHPLKGTNEAVAMVEALKKKYGVNMQAVGLGETRARLQSHWQYIRSAPRKEFSHVMKQLDVWLGASHTEGLGRLSLEAMSAGVAVVTTNTGAEFLKDGYNCLLYDVGDAQRGADLIDNLVQAPALMQQLVLNGHKTAEEAADPSRFIANMNKIIREVTKNET